MYNYELQHILYKDRLARRYFCGVLSIDQLPLKKFKRRCMFIVNTQPISSPGEHWFAIHISRSNFIEYFDPYGIKPINQRVQEFIRINGNRYICNDKKIQHDFSKNCGKYCVFYLYFKSRNYTMNQILKFFLNNSMYNDNMINNFYSKLT